MLAAFLPIKHTKDKTNQNVIIILVTGMWRGVGGNMAPMNSNWKLVINLPQIMIAEPALATLSTITI